MVDVRQYLLYTVRPQTVPTNLVAKIGNAVQDTYVLDQTINYNYVKDLSNDLIAFNKADVSVLTIEQQEEVSPKMLDKTDYVIDDIFEVTKIDF